MANCLYFDLLEEGEGLTLDLPWVGWDSDQSPAAEEGLTLDLPWVGWDSGQPPAVVDERRYSLDEKDC
jgi:hypothetical protein